MTEDAAPRVEDLIALPGPALPAHVRAAPRAVALTWPEALRSEAGRFYHSDAATARRIAARALEVAKIIGDPIALGWGHRAVAESLLFSGRMRGAEAAYAAAARAWRQAGAAGLLGQLLVGRVHVLSLLGMYREAEESTREARENLEAAGDRVYLAKLAMNLGNRDFQQDRYASALEEYDRAAALFKKLHLRDETVVGCAVNRGVALSNLNRDEDALTAFDGLERECDRRGYDLLLAQVRMNAAWVRSQRADFDIALRELALAAAYFERTEHPAFSATCRLNRAEIYHQLNLYQEARELTEEAGPLFAAEGLHYDEALSLAQGALAAMAGGDYSIASHGIRRARALFLKERNASRAALMELLLAESLVHRNRSQAVARARVARDAFRELRLIRWEAAAEVLLDRLESPTTTPRVRIARFRGLLRRIPKRLYPLAAYRALDSLGRAQEDSGNARAAAVTYRSAVTRLEDIRARIPTEDSKIAFLEDKTRLYDRLLILETQTRRPSLDRLFEWMERSRAQSLFDRLRNPAAYLVEGRPDKVVDEQRRQLTWLHARISRLELGTPEQRAEASSLRGTLARAEAAWSRGRRSRAEEGAGRSRHTPSHSRRTSPDPAASITVADVRAALPEGWGFLSYHLGPDFSLAVAITRSGAAWRTLRPDLKGRLEGLAERLDFQWGAAAAASASRNRAGTPRIDPGVAAFTGGAPGGRVARGSPGARPTQGLEYLRRSADAILTEAFRLLWNPIEEMGVPATTRWIVSPHGPIHRLPLHALRCDRGYLAESIDIALVPSARIWSRLARPPRDPLHRAYVAGVPSPHLPAVAPEIESVCRILASGNPVRDLAPTRAALTREGRRARLVHLAAHGALRRDNPAYSYIQLVDGPLFVHDLAGLRFPSSVVVLTACSSGRGAAPAGDEWIGLARGFLQAGASTVVASLWPIEDESTQQLVERFYAALSPGRSVPEALGTAMRSLLPLRPNPWNWASLAVLGGV